MIPYPTASGTHIAKRCFAPNQRQARPSEGPPPPAQNPRGAGAVAHRTSDYKVRATSMLGRAPRGKLPYEQPLDSPHNGQTKHDPARCNGTPHNKHTGRSLNEQTPPSQDTTTPHNIAKQNEHTPYPLSTTKTTPQTYIYSHPPRAHPPLGTHNPTRFTTPNPPPHTPDLLGLVVLFVSAGRGAKMRPATCLSRGGGRRCWMVGVAGSLRRGSDGKGSLPFHFLEGAQDCHKLLSRTPVRRRWRGVHGEHEFDKSLGHLACGLVVGGVSQF